MRLSWLCLTFLAVAVVVVSGQSEITLAQPCNVTSCTLPDCQCSTTAIPGGLAPRDTPQFVVLTFDDAVTQDNIPTYRSLLYNRVNFNGCRVGATFYVSHEWTDYQLVSELYNRGLEIALHSISHMYNFTYWAQATYEDMVLEFADQRIQMSFFANIPMILFEGLRIPFIQNTGNASFHVMKDYGILYDSSWLTVQFQNPGMRSYTLDYASSQDCAIQPCPTASFPGVWVFPIIPWTDLQGQVCSFVDDCVSVPDLNDEEAWFQFILDRFERHYFGSRSPFPFYFHEWFIQNNPAVYRAVDRFIELITRIPDTFMVNERDVIEWSRNPVPINEYRAQTCRPIISTTCPFPNVCQLTSAHNGVTYWMSVCTPCPLNYPWLGNPLGL